MILLNPNGRIENRSNMIAITPLGDISGVIRASRFNDLPLIPETERNKERNPFTIYNPYFWVFIGFFNGYYVNEGVKMLVSDAYCYVNKKHMTNETEKLAEEAIKQFSKFI